MKKLRHLFFLLTFIILLAFLDLSCSKDDNPSNSGIGSTTVKGELTLPAVAAGKTFVVAVDYDLNGDNGFPYSTTGTCGTGTTVVYSITNVAAGNYYIYSVVFLHDDPSQGPQNGDFMGFYGGTLSNPPSSPNASVASSGTVSFDFNLEIMP